jgi:hypothetical protein
MESKQDIWPLLTFKALAGGINYGQEPNQQPTYQRDGGVWDLEQEQLLIDSVLKDIDIPKIYLRKLDSGPYKYEVIDGQQRIRALWRFLNDEFSLEEGMKDLLVDGQSYPLAEKTCSSLDDDVKTKRLFAYPLTVVIISQSTEDEVADLFFRLNNGTPLTAAEVRNSMPGKVTKFVRELAVHSFFKKCAFRNSRKAYDQVAAQMLCLEINGGLTDISDKILTPMYHEWESGLPLKVTRAVKKNLELLDRTFPDKSRLLKRATTINMYLLTSYLSKRHNLTKAANDIHKWLEKTEPKRLKDPGYYFLMTRAANSRASIEGRFRWILTEFLEDFDKFRIVELDSQRNFNELQKAEIFARDGGKCQGTFCGGKIIKGDKWHADHIVPWIQGGLTEVNNGQILCPTCNQKKGIRFW